MFSKKIFLQSVICIAFLFSSLQASARANPYGGVRPEIKGEPVVKIKKYEPSGGDLPVGAYRIPDTSFVLMDQNKTIGTGFAVLLGPIGILAANQSAKAAASESLSGEKTQLIDLADFLDGLLSKQVPTLAKKEDASQDSSVYAYVLKPRTWISITKEQKVIVTVMLGVELYDASGTNIWRFDYKGYQTTDEHPLTGDDGWFGHHGEYLNKAASQGLEVALNKFLEENPVKVREAYAR